MLIDTPGMRELGNISVDAGIDETFSDIVDLTMNCKFNNCTHVKDKNFGKMVKSVIKSKDRSK